MSREPGQDDDEYMYHAEEQGRAADRRKLVAMAGFAPSPLRLDGEADERLAMGANKIKYHVPYLDDLLLGIWPHDLVLLGAWTGVGKTAAASMIAADNARAGKRVHYFALEAEPREIERRIKFRLVCDLLWNNRPMTARQLSMRYVDWLSGRYADHLKREEAVADEDICNHLRTLHTYYRGTSFGGVELGTNLAWLEESTDLVVLDHLHYVDADGDNENRAYKETVKLIRDTALRLGVPVICVVHLRKRDNRAGTLVPTLDEVMGSSDIAKIATHAIMLAPMGADDYAMHWTNPLPRHLSPTYVHVAKDRRGGLTPYCAVSCFDKRTSGYEDTYRLGKLSQRGETFTAVSGADLPTWATHADGREAEPEWQQEEYR
jgi:hypothetical protein